MRSLKDNLHAIIDLGVVLTIGIIFVALMVFAYLLYVLFDEIATTPSATTTVAQNSTYYSVRNVTGGFDDSVNLLLVAITVFILALAISALLMLRGR